MADIAAYIKTHLVLAPAKAVPEILLYQAHPKSGLTSFLGEDAPPPYWAYGWAGGTVLACYLLDHPELVAGKNVRDIGTGSGVVAIAAAKVGAKVTAIDIDPHAVAAARLNAQANNVQIEVEQGDALALAVDADVITVGDLFYDEALAKRNLAFLQTCRVQVLIGDPNRKSLPREALVKLADYSVPDFGQSAPAPAAIYTLAGKAAERR
ncbi:class I SAM-dependent methyltransferase [Aestuariivirga litoralis]|uniref:class I SAM-dependent methyltransferase n=1 Tax=Aestuariivirga litoralis TaxID=2650924 RepID=UPI0032B21CF0